MDVSVSWKSALWRAIPVALLIVGLFYYWFAIANRFLIFLYGHLGATYFDEPTASRYWMAGLVASGALLVCYTAIHAVSGAWARSRGKSVSTSAWWRVWVLCAGPLSVVVYHIARYGDVPHLPPMLALACVGSTLVGVALALIPAGLATRATGEFVWRAVAGLGIAPALLLLRVIELPATGLLAPAVAYPLALGSTLAGALGSGVVAWLYVRRHGAAWAWHDILVAALCWSYLLLPLVHHLFFTPVHYRYITTKSNFFALTWGVQGLCWIVAAALSAGVTRLQHHLVKKEL
jgi:hypothetical protein